MPQPKSKFNRKAWDEQIEKDQKEAYERKDDSGVFKSIFKDEVPRSAFWEHKAEAHQVNVVGYIVGENTLHPTKKPGEIVLFFEVGVHKGLIPNANHVCMATTYKRKCAYCDTQNELRKNTNIDKDVIKSYYPQRRTLYNLEVLDNPKEQEKGIQIFDVAQFLFQKPLEEAAINPVDGGIEKYASPAGGKIVAFIIKDGTYKNEKTGQSGKKQDFTSFKFINREPLDDSLFERAWKFDELLYLPNYDEIYDILHEVKVPKDRSYHDQHIETQPEEERQEDVGNYEPEPELESEIENEPEQEGELACSFEGVTFGEDFDKFEECNSCELQEECKAKYDEINKPKKPSPKPKAAPQAAPSPRRRPGR